MHGPLEEALPGWTMEYVGTGFYWGCGHSEVVYPERDLPSKCSTCGNSDPPRLERHLIATQKVITTETPDYHGPTKDGQAIPDLIHERVHEVVKDVLAGRVMLPARRQLQEALKDAPKEKAAFPVRCGSQTRDSLLANPGPYVVCQLRDGISQGRWDVQGSTGISTAYFATKNSSCIGALAEADRLNKIWHRQCAHEVQASS